MTQEQFKTAEDLVKSRVVVNASGYWLWLGPLPATMTAPTTAVEPEPATTPAPAPVEPAATVVKPKTKRARTTAKLTVDQVQYIRKYKGVMKQKDIAAMLGVDQSTISMIQRGLTWQDVA